MVTLDTKGQRTQEDETNHLMVAILSQLYNIGCMFDIITTQEIEKLKLGKKNGACPW